MGVGTQIQLSPELAWCASVDSALPPRHLHGASTGLGISGFECIAEIGTLLSPERARILGVLIDAARVTNAGTCEALLPIWQAEAVQRAERLAELTLLLDRNTRPEPWQIAKEYKIAAYLSACYHSLETGDDRAARTCAGLLRDVGLNLVSLFSPIAGSQPVLLDCSIEYITLPGYKRRALTLIASRLILDMLISAATCRDDAQIGVALWTLEPGLVQFTLTDYLGVLPLLPAMGSVHDLASLLEADLTVHAPCHEPARVDLVFPLRA